MAIFLEDTAVAKKETFSLNECTEAIEYGCHSLNESIAYSEAAWQNIIITSMKEEYKVLSEAKETGDEEAKKSGIGEAIKTFFKRVIEWVKRMFIKIKDFVKSVWDKLTDLGTRVQDFAKKHEKEIRAGGANCETTVTINKWKNGIPFVDVIANTFKSGKFSDLEAVDAAMKRFIEEEGTTEVAVKDVAGTAIEGALKAGHATKGIVANIKAIEKPLKETDKAANEGLNANDEAKAQKAKEKVEKGKTEVNTNSKMASACVKLVTRALKDAHKVNVAAFKNSKAGAKSAKVAEKEAKKTEKADK